MTENNFLMVTNNNHSEGFPKKVYLLGQPTSQECRSAVFFIPYNHKAFILNNGANTFVYLPVLKEIEFNEVYIETLPEYPKSELKEFKQSQTKEEYIEKVNKLLSHIQRGDIYEVNYCLEFYIENIAINPFSLFKTLNEIAEAPYSALLRIDNKYVISASPELFLKKDDDKIITKPIKGTIKRGKTVEEDQLMKKQLVESLKERTENVMIVDVARNDLSVVAKRGSVAVPKLFDIESYKTVHQMVSTVTCEVNQDININSIIGATFPMASMTGAPKIRAMQLIDKHESFKRTEYSGTLGIIDEKGDFISSVLIRTIVYDKTLNRISFAVGSAITSQCNPEKEYEECLLKAEALKRAVEKTIQA